MDPALFSLRTGWHALLGASAGTTGYYVVMSFLFAVIPSSGHGPHPIIGFLLSYPSMLLVILMPLTLAVAVQSIRRHAGTSKPHLAFSAGMAACLVIISIWPFHVLI